MMDRDEVEGVIAHEVAHIKHRDILIGSVAAAVAGAITMVANWAQWALVFGSGARQEDEDEERGSSSPVGSIVMIILAPLAAGLIQMAIARSREYLADAAAAAARFAGTANGLISALEKLGRVTRVVPMPVNAATAHLYISNPLNGGGLMNLFSTHPPLEERIRRLRSESSHRFSP